MGSYSLLPESFWKHVMFWSPQCPRDAVQLQCLWLQKWNPGFVESQVLVIDLCTSGQCVVSVFPPEPPPGCSFISQPFENKRSVRSKIPRGSVLVPILLTATLTACRAYTPLLSSDSRTWSSSNECAKDGNTGQWCSACATAKAHMITQSNEQVVTVHPDAAVTNKMGLRWMGQYEYVMVLCTKYGVPVSPSTDTLAFQPRNEEEYEPGKGGRQSDEFEAMSQNDSILQLAHESCSHMLKPKASRVYI
ncbi:hypothetical protein CI102_6555 [Trichoderma harzianum]|nr:hypothetical protein CI102_6555 [Trichoderma harzianum]